MLSILPFDRASSSSQRDSERPFKSYPRVPVSLPTSSFYSPFATHPSFGVSSYFPGSSGFPSSSLSHSAKSSSASDYHSLAHHHHQHHHHSSSTPSPPSSSSTSTPGTMDLRPPPHHLDAMPNLIDISQSTPGGAPLPGGMGHLRGHSDMMHSAAGIKQEQNCSLPHVSNSLSQSSMYQPLMSQSHSGMGGGGPQHAPLGPQLHLPQHNHGQAPSPQHQQPTSQQQQPDPIQHVRPPSSSAGTNSPPSSGGSHSNNHDSHDSFRMPPKKRPLSVPENLKDDSYWDKRKKNNDSAKRSRDARRMKEEQIAMRVVYLEQENLQLRTEVSLLKSEIEKLRCMLYNS